MIRFFRTLRQHLLGENRFSKYLLYAIGEIVLVVIGILIALQINNWNESRKEQKVLKEVLLNLKQDIEEDLVNLESLKKRLQERSGHAAMVLSALQDPGSLKDTSALVVALTRSGWILNYTPTFATYKEIMNSGKLSLIGSEDLKKALADYLSQVEDNRRIEGAYETGLKEAERTAVGYFKTPPQASNALLPVPDTYSTLQINLEDLSQNAAYVENLKHIRYHTDMEILYKESLIRPRALRTLKLIENELRSIQ